MLRVNAGQLEVGNKIIVKELAGGCAEPDVSFVLWIKGNEVHMVQTGDDVGRGPEHNVSMQRQGSRNEDEVHLY